MFRAGALLAILPLALCGCASAPALSDRAMLTYETVPKGAMLYEGKVKIGPAPHTLTYVAEGKSKTMVTPDVTAVWPSGATATFWTNLQIGDDRVATLTRPAAAPNEKVDLAHAEIVEAEAKALSQTERMQAAEYQRSNSAACQDRKLVCFAAH